MKKSLLALGVLSAFSGLAFAASNVTLYGIIDAGVVAQRIGGAKSGNTVDLKSGFNSGARWGIKGVEELGNGLKVGFILEQGFDIDNGATDNGFKQYNSTLGDEETAAGSFNRESKLYVEGNFGQIAFGRLGSLAGGAQTNNMLTGWALGTAYGAGSWTSFALGNGRLNNAVAYTTPVFAGFKVSVEYSNGIVSDANKFAGNHHYYGIGAQYEMGGFKNSLIFEATDAKGKNSKNATYNNAQYLINLGLGYKFGPVTPMFAYQYNWQDGGNKDNVFGLSAAINAAGGTAKIGAKYLLGKNDGAAAGAEDKRRAWSINAAYEYPLSKRTKLWSYAGYADGSKALDQKETAGQKIGYNGYQVGVGMVHTF